MLMLMKTDRLRGLLPFRRLKTLSRKQRFLIFGLALAVSLLYAGYFGWPKKISFSYAEATCSKQLTVLPDLHRTVDSSQFHLKYQGGLVLGRVRLMATEVCFIANATPATGTVRVTGAPFGGWLFRVRYDVDMGEAPQVVEVASQAQTLSKPLSLKLNQADRVFQYHLDAETQKQSCVANADRLECGMDKLGLKQGASYELQLRRSYKGVETGSTTAIKVEIIPAAKVTASSILSGAMVYAKPKSADLTLDRSLVSGVAKLEMIDGDKAQVIPTRVKVADSHVSLEWDEELARQKTFKLTLESATGADGSVLDEAYSVDFQTSGGPKVASINIGGSGVAADARVVVTFDQALSAATNITSLAHIGGGGAAISRLGNNQVVFVLRSIPRCTAFTLSIDKGLESESGVVSDQAWSHASRVNCRATRTIGYSVQGRPIVAYFYGSGATTVLFTGGIHGDEPSGSYIMQDWISHLDANAQKIPANKQVVVVPALNPDGLALNKRYNVNNVNLDRNFPSSDWVRDISIGGGGTLPQGGGSVPFSEPETRAIADLTSSLSVRAEISFHSSGSLVGANKVADSVAIGTTYASAVGYGKMFANPEAIFGYTLTGEYETWMGEKAGTPAILIELPTSTGRYFSRHQNVLWSMVNL